MAAGKYLSDKAELDQDTEHHSKINPVLGAWSTFIAFIILGAVPLIAYVIQPWLQLTSSVTFRLACILTLLALFFVGFLKGYFVKQNRFYAGFKTMMIGAMAAGISYGIGFYIESLVS